MQELTILQKFRIARDLQGHTTEQVAQKLNYSKRYIYEVLRHPEKNKELHKKIMDYMSRPFVNNQLN